MGLEKLEKRIKQFEIEHANICIFGHRDYNCPHIGEKYCINGGIGCPYYSKQLKKLEDAGS